MIVPSDPRSQTMPMDAIDEVLSDYDAGHCNVVEAISTIRGIVCEWKY